MRRLPPLVVAVVVALGGLIGIGAGPSAGAAPPAGSPIGAFDGVAARFDGRLGISGWAVDPDAPDQAIDVSLVGPTGAVQVQTGDPRPDVAAAVPGAGPNSGWHLEVGANAVGPVCAYAGNVGPGGNQLLGCRALAVSGTDGREPLGSLDRVRAAPGLLRLQGWAGDPDSPAPTQLRVSYDGRQVLQTPTSLARPDVAALGLGPTTGFALDLPIVPGGHLVCVDAQNSGAHGRRNSTVGCSKVFVPGVRAPRPHDPVGSFDGIRSESGAAPGDERFASHGWAYDPDRSGSINVRVRSFGETYIGGDIDTNHFLRNQVFRTGKLRPDVQAAVPGAGPNAGYDGLLEPWGAWTRVVVSCAYAVDVGPGTGRLIGCTTDPPVIS